MHENWHNQIIDDVERKLETNVVSGLTTQQVNERLAKYGYNELKEGKKKSLFVKFLEQFKDFMVIVLIIAAIISGFVGVKNGEGFTDTIIIMVVIICNSIIGVAQESKAEKSLEALKKLSSHVAKVVRNGNITTMQSRELVPGDLVILETGDYIPADLRIVEAINLKVQESSLTGESVPVDKSTDAITNKEVGIGDRTNMLYSSSLVTYGRGRGIVVETGMNTEVGHIAESINQVTETATPLQIKLDKLGKTLGIACLIICALIFVISLVTQKLNGDEVDYLKILMTAVSLAVAAIPEGLVAVSTIVLAIGMQKMVKKHAIIKKLPAVETLGSATVICSDKTGTLTQNKMTVQKVCINGKVENIDAVPESKELDMLVNVCVLCNDTKIAESGSLQGDPTETALTQMAMDLGYNVNDLAKLERIEEIPFDSSRKLMTTVHEADGKYYVFTQGGIDELLEVCLVNGEIKKDISEYKKLVDKQNDDLAHEALRVLAMAYKELDHNPTKEDMKSMEKDLIFVGMVGMIDPPRVEVKAAVDKCKTAGIKTVMITGDHKSTAVAIAKNLGILNKDEEAILGADVEKMSQEDLEKSIRNYSVYARVSPEHKVRIVRAWQSKDEVVAMTGDGVNDAPALKQSDIGCAMGIVGTDVSKEAADVILTDDNFATIVSAVEEGRRIYDNILKAISFLLSSNVGEVVVLFFATLLMHLFSTKFDIPLGLLEVLTPVHLLWINLVTDSLPALALSVDPPEKDIMERKPLKTKGIFTKGMAWRIIYQGFMIGILTLIAFIIGLSTPDADAMKIIEENRYDLSVQEVKVEIGQAMAFIVLAFSELVHIFNIRNPKHSLFKTGIGGNKYLFGAVLIDSFLMFIVLFVPFLRNMFGIPVIPMNNIWECVALIFAPILVVEIMKLLRLNGKE